MVKWLVITLVVVASFFAILLGFGYLLKENEQQNLAYIKAQGQRASLSQLGKQQANTYSENLAVIAEHLTCVSTDQCVAADVKFANKSCIVAVNMIGAAKLAQVTDTTIIDACPNGEDHSRLVCRNSLCQLLPEPSQ